MKPVFQIGLYLVCAGALQACSSASDMGTFTGASSTQPESAAAQQQAANTGGSESGTNQQTNAEALDTAGDAILVANASGVACEASAESFRQTMLAVINDSRQQLQMCGSASRPAVGLVSWNDRLSAAAAAHARDMVTVNFFSHDGSDGLGVSDRADSAGYDWRAIGENIAAGQLDIEEVHQGWLASPGHCRNIMNGLYTEVGADCLSNSNTDFGTYWVVVFGDQR